MCVCLCKSSIVEREDKTGSPHRGCLQHSRFCGLIWVPLFFSDLQNDTSRLPSLLLQATLFLKCSAVSTFLVTSPTQCLQQRLDGHVQCMISLRGQYDTRLKVPTGLCCLTAADSFHDCQLCFLFAVVKLGAGFTCAELWFWTLDQVFCLLRNM